MANTFPSTVKKPDYGMYKESSYKPARRTEFEGNTISTRPRATKVRRKFIIGWRSMSQSDKVLVTEFFEANQGYAFNFTPPHSTIARLCVFATDEITAVAVAPQPVSPGETMASRWSLSIELYECEDSVILANTP